MFWMMVAWFFSLALAWIFGAYTVIGKVLKYPERIGLEKVKTERKEN